MRRTIAVFALVLSSLAAALFAAIRAPGAQPAPPVAAAWQRAGALQVSTRLERRYLGETGGGEAYLQIDVAADPAEGAAAHRVPVNAVMIIDRSGSMSGEKIERAREAARALIAALNGEDRLAIIDFASDAQVLVESTPASDAAKERALAAVARLQATSGTNLSAALDLARPQLERGRGPGRADKIFLASDGQANEGVADRAGLLAVAQRDFGPATVSTFGVGDDYDEDLMTALAAQAGGRTRFIRDAGELVPAFRAELSRASAMVARGVRLDVRALSGARVLGVPGYQADGGWIRLPDFAAGEQRRVMVKLALPPGHGVVELARVELAFADPSGADHKCEAAAQATYTADAARLGEAPNDAATNGARVEMAQLAQLAAEAREKGRAQEAQQQLAALRVVAKKAQAAAPPPVAAALEGDAMEFDEEVNAVGSAGGAGAGKRVKQRAFDAARAPVAGW